MIKAKNIYKSFGSLEILKGININIKKSELVSITGNSGAGKSTLLHILSGLEYPTIHKGIDTEIKLLNQDIQKLSNKKLSKFRNKSIGFIFQFYNLLNEFTVLENVCLPGYIGNREKKKLQKEAKELLKKLGLEKKIYFKPKNLSGGEQQRTAIARALINHPKIIFADEPSGNLDSKNTKELYKIFFSLRKKFKQIFIIATHDLEFAKKTDRQFHIYKGKLF